MNELSYVLITDGTSDVALLPILDWLLRENGVLMAIQREWADLGRVHLPRRPKLAEKIEHVVNIYSCDLLFIHRDAEREPRENRVKEIMAAAGAAMQSVSLPPPVCVVPVRMQEAWLLFDEDAIKWAAGNRSYRPSLDLPPLDALERLANPKEELYNRLRQASGLRGYRLKRFLVSQGARRVTEFIDDFSPLRSLPAFSALEEDVIQVITKHGWTDLI